jgi:hypothetical protein
VHNGNKDRNSQAVAIFVDVVQIQSAQKNREENKFSSRVEVGIVTPKAFGVVKDEALMPLSFC